jgi:hypothetical protein
MRHQPATATWHDTAGTVIAHMAETFENHSGEPAMSRIITSSARNILRCDAQVDIAELSVRTSA